MPLYIFNIHEAESAYAPGGEADIPTTMKLHQDFGQIVADSTATLVAGEALAPMSSATFLRGTCTADVKTIDNPLPDVKETLGGFYLLDVEDEAQAQELAKSVPAPHGYVEVRPVFVWS